MDDDPITFSCHDNDMNYDFIDDVTDDDNDFDDVNSDDFDFASTRRHNTAPSQFNNRVNNTISDINTNNNDNSGEIRNVFMVNNDNQGNGQMDLPVTNLDTEFPGQSCDVTVSSSEAQQPQNSSLIQCSSSSSGADSTPTPTTEDMMAECRFGGSFAESRTSRNAWGNESYATIIRNAIHSKPGKKARLSEIYQFFTDRIPYFNKHKESKGWKNSVRHNLSLGKQFKRKQSADPKEKGSFWVVDDEIQGQTPTRTSSMSNTSTRNMVTAKRKNSGGRDVSSNLNRPARCKSETSIGIRTNISSGQNPILPTGEVLNGFQITSALEPDLNVAVLNVEPMDSCNDLDLTSHFSDLGSSEAGQDQRPRAVTIDSVPRSNFVSRNQMWLDPLVSVTGVSGIDTFQSPPMCSSNQVQQRKLLMNNEIMISTSKQISRDESMKTSAKHADQHDTNFAHFSEFSNANIFQNKPTLENATCHHNFTVNNLNFSLNPGCSTNNQIQVDSKFGIHLPVLSHDSNQNISIHQTIPNLKSNQQIPKTEVSSNVTCYNQTNGIPNLPNIHLFCSENNNNPYISGSNFSNSNFNNEVFVSHAANTSKERFESLNNSNFAIDPAEQMNLNSSVRSDFAHLRQNSLSEDISKINPSLNELLYENPLSLMSGQQGSISPICTRSSVGFPAALTSNFVSPEPIQRFSNMTIDEPAHALNTHGRPPFALTNAFPSTLKHPSTTFQTHHNPTTNAHYTSAISPSVNNPNSTAQLPFGFASNQHNGGLSLPIALPSQPLPTSTFAFVAHT